MKLVMNDAKTGKSYQTEIDKSAESKFYGLKIGSVFNGELIDLQGFQFQITGGSDKSGFPMRPEIKGSHKKRILISKSIGYRGGRKGERRKKSVRGHIISEDIAQINAKIIKYGKADLKELFGKKKEEGEEK